MKKHSFLIVLLLTAYFSYAQRRSSTQAQSPASPLESVSLGGLKFRNIGPALTSGRIADIAVNPSKTKVYYVATAAGGVWKTENGGATFDPLFDSEGSSSIGCVALDPNNSNVVWVGSGENNNQRVVGYGDGVYKSIDGGKSWENMGLKMSEHIAKIIVDPTNSDVVYVAAIGPLWKEGGERGVYKTEDGGKTWTAVLTIDEHTGVTDMVMDPRDPKVIYAAAMQRRRHVFTYIGGGPGSGMYKTTDGGQSWSKINKGLPTVDMGRIGLTISPANPEVIYAIVEAAQNKGGFFRSTNRGASWEKRSDYTTSGNYYQEIFSDPVDPDKVYAMDVWFKVSKDGGKSFSVVGEDTKHVDNHVMWIDPADTEHWLVGCDGGVYETYEAGKTWFFKANLPVTQFYKVTVDNALPFYNVYGGTQDNFSLGGPSRTITNHGILNSDWIITHGGDGFESAVDPKNPDIVYAQSQYGGLSRYDKKSGEEVGIQPKERKGEANYRWNWDAPLLVSRHKDGRVYFAANKVFRSDDRGNSWDVISDDLSQQIDRNKLKVMGRVWGIDAVSKNGSTSPFGSVVALAESPVDENLLYAGTDDGLIQVTENGGQSWRKQQNFPGVPTMTYVNYVLPSQHDAGVVYAAFNHHKYGDFKPYIYKSSDKGVSWASITANLPVKGTVYSIAEDHVDPNLLFAGTEYGIFFTNDGGKSWKQLKAGMPTIAIKDIDIQRRENDLVLASFGRGFFVLDDYSALRQLGQATLAKDGALFPIRNALAYEESMPLGLPGKAFQGDDYYAAENLGPVAIFTWYLKDEVKTKEEVRREAEKKQLENNQDSAYPSYEALKEEKQEPDPYLLFTIRDSQGNIVRKLQTKPVKGVNRTTWDLRYAPKTPVSLNKPSFYNAFAGKEEGHLVVPGRYTVQLSKSVDGMLTNLSEEVGFEVVPLQNTVLPAANRSAMVVFKNEVAEFQRVVEGTQSVVNEIGGQMRYIREAILRTEAAHGQLMAGYEALTKQLADIRSKLNRDGVASELDKEVPPTIASRVGAVAYEQMHSTSDPTQTHKDQLAIAKEEFDPIYTNISQLITGNLKSLLEKLQNEHAPYIPAALPVLPVYNK
ncbi:glycosyl hydrolase [Imperialibacter roseus]|uniref:Glycosyl hydrolase n=1 Tax=Imperialibacter roseus TaxID=1324217 RepID=A0ABZ0J027_9BACT|nr:glycosyl hydrolase [Imperialibacter roseus]WOK09291.1 glycosyl hydrolase [Imperialibacter roseus]